MSLSNVRCVQTNVWYAVFAPLLTFWLPLALVTVIIVKIFRTMAMHDKLLVVSQSSSCEKIQATNSLPWRGTELLKQQQLALTFWSIYWNVTLFWIPNFVW